LGFYFSDNYNRKSGKSEIMSKEGEQTKFIETDEEKVANQFQLVEQKIGSLLELTETLKQERADFTEKLRVQKEALDTLSKEIVSLRAEKKQEKRRILTLIERIDRMFLGIN
jgi:chromosome segregation ATPase